MRPRLFRLWRINLAPRGARNFCKPTQELRNFQTQEFAPVLRHLRWVIFHQKTIPSSGPFSCGFSIGGKANLSRCWRTCRIWERTLGRPSKTSRAEKRRVMESFPVYLHCQTRLGEIEIQCVIVDCRNLIKNVYLISPELLRHYMPESFLRWTSERFGLPRSPSREVTVEP